MITILPAPRGPSKKLWPLLIFLFFYSCYCFAGKKDIQDDRKTLTTKNLKEEVIDFKNINEILKKDFLEEERKKKDVSKEVAQKNKKSDNINGFYYPAQHDFWKFASEYWLVKNAVKLAWDFSKPDYGIIEYVVQLFESLHIYIKKIQVLMVKTPDVTHFALPTNKDESLLVLSLPFIRVMNLTKLEISLILLEDYLRSRKKIFDKYVMDKLNLKEILGKNFYGKKIDMKLMDSTFQYYDDFVNKVGFNFQQQYEVTMEMTSILKGNLHLLSAYNNLLTKIDSLIKRNKLYENYNRIYPSPEVQKRWIFSKNENL